MYPHLLNVKQNGLKPFMRKNEAACLQFSDAHWPILIRCCVAFILAIATPSLTASDELADKIAEIESSSLLEMRSLAGLVTSGSNRVTVEVRGICTPPATEEMAIQTFFTLTTTGDGGSQSDGVEVDEDELEKLLTATLESPEVRSGNRIRFGIVKGKVSIASESGNPSASGPKEPLGVLAISLSGEEARKIRRALERAKWLRIWLQPRIRAFNEAK